MEKNNFLNLAAIFQNNPDAFAVIKGGSKYTEIYGTVYFYQLKFGCLVAVQATNLPYSDLPCSSRIFGFHIHSGNACSGTGKDEFSNTLSHFNPANCPHPHHAGDLPPLFSNGGKAFMAFITDRFTVKQIIGKTVIIHSSPDDFTTQPSGNSGEKIACGEITLKKP